MISIIIPCKGITEASKCIDECLNLDYDNYEIIVLPDYIQTIPYDSMVRYIATGEILPSHKRDIGIKEAKGDIVAFIDSDAYPDRDWLKEAQEALDLHTDFKVAGVCGPGIIPPDSPEKERTADWILRHLPRSYRVERHPAFFLDDYPTFNLIFKKEVVKRVGGFSCDFMTGEDTILCKKICKLGYKILYHPNIVVYHRRRPVWKPFLKQISIWGFHTGHFIRKGL